MKMHDMVHMYNVAMQTLSNLPIIQSLKTSCNLCMGILLKAIKKYLEFFK